MHHVSDVSRGGSREQLNAQTLRAASTEALWGLLQTEMILLEQESAPGGNWRLRRERTIWARQLISEIRARGQQLRLG